MISCIKPMHYEVFFSYLAGPCVPNPCHNGGTCEISEAYRGDTFIGYVCKCPRGFNGIHCQHSKLFIFNVLLFLLIYLLCTSHYPSCLQASHRFVERHRAQAFWLMLPLSTVGVVSHDEARFSPHTLFD